MKIWLPALKTGSGASVFVLRLASALQRQGHIPIVQWFDHWFELAPWLLGRVAPPAGTDVIHTNTWIGFAFKRAGIPLVVTEHHYVDHPLLAPLKGPLQRLYHRTLISRFNRWSYAAADAVTAVSQFCADAMTKDLNFPVQVIPNWINTEEFSPSPRPPRQGPFRLLFVGNPSPWKGADILPALAELLGPDYEIVCMGGLRKRFQAESIPANMTVAAPVPMHDMPAAYRSVDAVLVPTRYETFGYVAAEAMACGRPVAGFNRAGTAEICLNGTTALLAPVDDVTTLAQHVRRLANEPGLAERLGHNGRQHVLAHYAEDQAVSTYIDLYRQLVNHNHASK